MGGYRYPKHPGKFAKRVMEISCSGRGPVAVDVKAQTLADFELLIAKSLKNRKALPKEMKR
jgi:hypothetical protein